MTPNLNSAVLPPSLPLRFILTGVICLALGAVCLVARPDLLVEYHYNQHIIALTHLVVLGGIASIVMGAMYQLVPVALETKLFSQRLPKWHFHAHVIGFIGMVWMFWIWDMKQVGHFGSFVALGFGLFIVNLFRTLRRVPHWNVIATAVASSLVWLFLTMSAGLFLAAAKCWPISPFDPIAQLHAHAHLGILGVFVMLIVGVSYKLIPMFALSDIQNERRARWSVGLLNAGLAALVVTMLFGSAWKLAAALIIISGLALYGLEMRAMLRARKRVVLDWGVKSFVTAVAMLIPLSFLALVLCWPGLPLNEWTARLENLYGFLGIYGVVVFAIVGMLHKIIPFLVWHHTYSPHIGRRRIPALAEMYSSRVQLAAYGFYVAGLLLAGGAICAGHGALVRLGCALLAMSFALFAVNVAKILVHWFQPRLGEPIGMPKAGIPSPKPAYG
ncbi:MAG: hypothetical protein AB1705_11620 [Verrucomicrobiota bacterium]